MLLDGGGLKAALFLTQLVHVRENWYNVRNNDATICPKFNDSKGRGRSSDYKIPVKYKEHVPVTSSYWCLLPEGASPTHILKTRHLYSN